MQLYLLSPRKETSQIFHQGHSESRLRAENLRGNTGVNSSQWHIISQLRLSTGATFARVTDWSTLLLRREGHTSAARALTTTLREQRFFFLLAHRLQRAIQQQTSSQRLNGRRYRRITGVLQFERGTSNSKERVISSLFKDLKPVF